MHIKQYSIRVIKIKGIFCFVLFFSPKGDMYRFN